MKPIGVIIAGGSGTRLWPLSSPSKPKQLLEVNGLPLIEHAIKRLQLITDDITIVTTQEHEKQLRTATKNYRLAWLIEPCARNTAAAYLIAILSIIAKNPDAPVVIIPADHIIPDAQQCAQSIEHALALAAEQKKLVLLGAKPTYPAVHYGYISYEPATLAVIKFHEKPQSEQANIYYAQHNMLWNTGIVCARAHVLLDAFNAYAPEMVTTMNNFLQTHDHAWYQELDVISFDHLVLEKSNNCAVIPVTYAWSDVGDLAHFCAAQQPQTQIIEHKAQHNTVYGTNKPVLFVGVDNLYVIETDGLLLIVERSKLDHAKEAAHHILLREHA